MEWLRGLRASVAVCLGLIGWLCPVPGHGHSLPNHFNLTIATLRYLQDNPSPKLTCASKEDATHLQDLLLIGTVREDDWFSPGSIESKVGEMGRFVFHFTPKASGQGVTAECSSFDWSGLAAGNVRQKECQFQWFPRAQGGQLTTYNHKRANNHTWGAAVAGATIKLSGGQVTSAIGDDAILRQHGMPARAKAIEASGAAQGWIAAGYVLHLFQDLTSPAHSNNISHGHIQGPLGLQDWGSPEPLEADLVGAERVINFKAIPATGLIGYWVPSGLPGKTADQLFTDLHAEVTKRYSRSTWLPLHEKYAPVDTAAIPACSRADLLGVKECQDKRQEWERNRLDALNQAESAFVDFLAPLAVKYGASFLANYIQRYQPLLPGSCKFQ